jgi:hypothetical protein
MKICLFLCSIIKIIEILYLKAVVEFLLAKGASLSIADKNGWTPLHCAGNSSFLSLSLSHSHFHSHSLYFLFLFIYINIRLCCFMFQFQMVRLIVVDFVVVSLSSAARGNLTICERLLIEGAPPDIPVHFHAFTYTYIHTHTHIRTLSLTYSF